MIGISREGNGLSAVPMANDMQVSGMNMWGA